MNKGEKKSVFASAYLLANYPSELEWTVQSGFENKIIVLPTENKFNVEITATESRIFSYCIISDKSNQGIVKKLYISVN